MKHVKFESVPEQGKPLHNRNSLSLHGELTDKGTKIYVGRSKDYDTDGRVSDE
jgi:hypothetical protein